MVRATLQEQEIRRVIGLAGPGQAVVEGVAALREAADRCLCFINGPTPPAILEHLAAQRGGIVIVPRGFTVPAALASWHILDVEYPRAAIAKVLAFIRDEGRQPPAVTARRISADARISPLAAIEGAVEIGPNVLIEPFCTIGPDVAIGAGTVLRAGTRVFPRVSIGARTIIGANSVIGSDGFGFVRDAAGHKSRIPHLGGVVIGSDVEIGALTVVQQGTIAATRVDDYARIDDNVEVAHNARIGKGASVTGGVVIGGSAVIGANAWIGINAAVRNGRRVGARALVGMSVPVLEDLADRSISRAAAPAIRPRPDRTHRPIR